MLFNNKKNKREKKITWMTVRCVNCSTNEHPYIMYVKQEEFKLRPEGYKGRFRAYTACTKCGKLIMIKDQDVSKNILEYLMNKICKS